MAEPDDGTGRGPWARTKRFVAGLDHEKVLVAAVFAAFIANLVVSLVVPYATYVLVTQPAWEEEYRSHECHSGQGNDTVCPPPPIPSDMVWDGILNEYLLDMGATVSGLYLIVWPIVWAFTWQLSGFPWQPFVWLVAACSVPAVAHYGRPVHRWRLAVYGALIALQLSGFGAYHWSTLGD